MGTICMLLYYFDQVFINFDFLFACGGLGPGRGFSMNFLVTYEKWSWHEYIFANVNIHRNLEMKFAFIRILMAIIHCLVSGINRSLTKSSAILCMCLSLSPFIQI